MEQVAAPEVVDPHRPLGLLDTADAEHCPEQELLRALRVVLQRGWGEHPVRWHELGDRLQRGAVQGAVPLAVALRPARPDRPARATEGGLGPLIHGDRRRRGHPRLQERPVALGDRHGRLRRPRHHHGILRVAATRHRRADRVAGDPLDVGPLQHGRLLGRNAPALQLRSDLAEEDRGQPRTVLPGRPTGVGDDQPLRGRVARERELQRLLAAASATRRDPADRCGR